MPRDDLFVWMDLEMTSVVDARVDQIIEIAVVITDKNLAIVAEGPDLVIHADAGQFEHIPESAHTVHCESGLMALAEASSLPLAGAEEQILNFLTAHVVPRSAPLCGNSIHVDRHFLALQMPRV